MSILAAIYLHCYAINKHTELKEVNESLSVTLNQQTNTITDLEDKNTNLSTHLTQLEAENKKLKEDNKSKNKTPEIAQISKRDFKSYMSYKAIINTSSKQYRLQQQASTDANGIRCINSRPMVAVGTGWGLKVGDTALITCENGNSFEVVIGDIKADVHTDASNKTTISNGCRCEFIVDMSNLNTTVKNRGNVAVLKQYNGYITNIVKI
jgi:predicted RNase H-like nuclease (RuvC/YqgF family)